MVVTVYVATPAWTKGSSAEMRSTVVVGVAGNTPPPIVEQIVVAPGPEYVWVGGGWFWYGDRWIWRHGYWNRPHYYRHDGYGRRW
jgi:hypothetical protein